MRYRKLHHWKYELMEEYWTYIDIQPDLIRGNVHLALYPVPDSAEPCGKLLIAPHYAWDGCSGPTIDDKTNMRASLIHDALYQLIREGHIERRFRKYADDLFKKILLEDGMGKFRAGYYHWAVRTFGWRSLNKKNYPANEVIEI